MAGRTLQTLDRGRHFDVVEVGDTSVIVRPHVSDIERGIRRVDIEGAFAELLECGQLSRSDIRRRYSNFNPAYVAAILAALPGVTHTLRPIVLFVKS